MGRVRASRPLLVMVLSALLMGAACAVHNRLNEYKGMLDPQLGQATQEQIATAWGPPQKRETIGESEFWTFYRSYGSRGSATAIGGTVVAGAHEQYDEVVMQFRKGVLISWRAYVQR